MNGDLFFVCLLDGRRNMFSNCGKILNVDKRMFVCGFGEIYINSKDKNIVKCVGWLLFV